MPCALCFLDSPGIFAATVAPRDADGRFHNNYPHDAHAGFWLWKWEQWRDGTPQPPPGGWPIPHRKADVARIRENRAQPLVTWIGHASFLLQLAGVNILIDPQFSERASPVAFAGPRRVVPLPLEMSELPRIDVVLITHNHYDHLDRASVKALAAQDGGSPRFLVPLGLAEWFRAEGLERVEEHDWWQAARERGVSFTLVPVQHWSKRTLWDTNRTLWGGWVIEGGGLRIVHAGDLGLSRDARDIGARAGPFDLALIPIGAYAPRWFMKTMHVDVADALQVRHDLRAARAVGMHWGTFEHLTDEPMDEPPRELERLRREAGLERTDFDVMTIGETRDIEPAREAPAPPAATR
ncbi:MAG TPA: MBL fold metallo-hydrolase [Usitatibacter sp.]|jgi:L-ascorbate metabolism protein UlaG (beta-lactamase superfamily)|nr:MBL fold metallo-hydrolase [Usitatibacter sp.]